MWPVNKPCAALCVTVEGCKVSAAALLITSLLLGYEVMARNRIALVVVLMFSLIICVLIMGATLPSWSLRCNIRQPKLFHDTSLVDRLRSVK